MSTQQPARWSVDQVLALAPDQASVVAGRKLAASGAFSEQGCAGPALWGLCAGSGKNPYRTVLDLSGPAYKCTCPSRKFPCKHALGLLFGWARGEVPTSVAEPPAFATQWLATRAARAGKAGAPAPVDAGSVGAGSVEAGPVEAGRADAGRAEAGQVQAQARAKRAAARAEKVNGGMLELQRWAQDQIRSGLAQLQGKGYGPFETVAARLVDAQAGGPAARVRGLPAVLAAGPTWPDLLLEELALLNLLARAHARLGELSQASPALAATVRLHVGYPVAKRDVLQTPGVADDWVVLAVRDTALDFVAQRSVHVYGAETGELATLLSFAPAGGSFDLHLSPGQQVRARLHRYPGSQRRGLLDDGETTEAGVGFASTVRAGGVEEALRSVAAAVAVDPWLRSLPLLVSGQPLEHSGGWYLVDDTGAALEVRPPSPWELVNACSGRTCPVLVEWTPTRWVPLAVLSPELGVLS